MQIISLFLRDMRERLLTSIFLSMVIFLGGAIQAAYGQEDYSDFDPVLIRLQALIVSISDGMPVPYAHVINHRTHSGTTSNSAGLFTMEMLNIDSLEISAMGFGRQTVRIPPKYTGDTVYVIRIRPVNYLIGEVKVTGEKQKVNMDGIPVGKPVDIDPYLRGDAFNEKPPVLAALLNPISYWQYYLSRREKQKRKAREALALEKNWELHSLNYNKKIVMMLTGLNDSQADEFMVWFNSQNILPYTATEYEVRAAVREYFRIYRRERGY